MLDLAGLAYQGQTLLLRTFVNYRRKKFYNLETVEKSIEPVIFIGQRQYGIPIPML
jgi:hypothetical protein